MATDTAVPLRALPDAIDAAVYTSDKWPLVVDPSGNAARFLKYSGSYTMATVPADATPEALRQRLVGALRYGRTMTVDVADSGAELSGLFTDGCFPAAVLAGHDTVCLQDFWEPLLRPEEGDPPASRFVAHDAFRLVVVCSSDEPPPATAAAMTVVRVANEDAGDRGGGGDAVEAAFGATEVLRNSKEMVEAAFDGDVEEVTAWLDKGYALGSHDGHNHTPLSEAACAGHAALCKQLLELGADPNTRSDLGRTPLHRAAFAGHAAAVDVLLHHGADPDAKDRALETPADATRDDGIRAALAGFDRDRTAKLRAEREAVIAARRDERIATAAQREAAAVAAVCSELVQLATAGDTEGLQAALQRCADDADREGGRPRGTARVRDERGNTLLALAAWHGHVDAATMLLTHHTTLSATLEETAVAVFRPGPVDSRDTKGWTPLQLAVFHDHPAMVALLLDHGANPQKENAFAKTAFSFATADKPAVRDALKAWGAASGYTPPDWESVPTGGGGGGGGGSGDGGAPATKSKGSGKKKAAGGAGKPSVARAKRGAKASTSWRGRVRGRGRGRGTASKK